MAEGLGTGECCVVEKYWTVTLAALSPIVALGYIVTWPKFRLSR